MLFGIFPIVIQQGESMIFTISIFLLTILWGLWVFVILLPLAVVLYLALTFVFSVIEDALRTLENLCQALDVEERRRRA